MQAKAVALDEARKGAKITPGGSGEIDSLLLEWRAKALYVSLLVIVGAGLPAYASVLINAIQAAQMTPLIWGYLAVYLAFVGLAISPRLDFRIRAWGFLLLGYTNALASFARLGLAGSGRLYLIAMPVIATMLLGSWAGYITGFLSLVIYSAFALLAHWGLLGNWLTLQANPLTLSFWSEAGAALAVFLALMVVLLERFHRLQVRTLAARRQAVAELEQTAAVLREREERLALVMQATNDGIWDWNLETDEVYFSPRWKAMLGYEEDDIPHRFEAWRGLVHPDDIERALAEIQAHLDGLTPLYTLEHRLLHKDGSYRWILARGIALRDSNAKPHRIAGSHSDITEHKRAQAIQAGQHRFLELLATGGDFSKTLHTLIRIIEEQWPEMDGIEATRQILEHQPGTGILVLTSFAADDKVFPAIKAGALGYLLKDSGPEDLVRAIHHVYRGEPSLEPSIARKVLYELSRPPREPLTPDPLTERELDVLRLIAQGRSNREIAGQLVITEMTVRAHVSNILGKLHLASRTQAALYALREGLASLEDIPSVGEE
jgi:NarL family two-component system response regulator LiaR